MPGALSSRVTQEAAASAWLNGVRGLSGICLAPVADMRLHYIGEVDALGCGWPCLEDAAHALEVLVLGAAASCSRVMGIQAGVDGRQAVLTVAVERSAPVLRLALGSPDFQELSPGRLALRHRPVFPSADPWYVEREKSLRRLAASWGLAEQDGRFHLGTWDVADGAWDVEARRRVLSLAWLLYTVRAKD